MITGGENELDDRADTEGRGPAALRGTVYRKSTGRYRVRSEGSDVTCGISSLLRKQLVYPIAAPWSLPRRVVAVEAIGAVDPVAIGDRVEYTPAGEGEGVITAVLPRRSALTRRAAGLKALEQVIVANPDQLVVVTAAARPAPKWDGVDRYLAGAEAGGLAALVCVTKADLADPAGVEEEAAAYRRVGYDVLLTSAVTGAGLGALRDALGGRLSVLAGPSGVGKSTLLNAIQPGLGLRVGAVSGKTGKGMHTTSHLEMFDLDGGGAVVDTPGMREFGLWGVEPGELAELFPELRPLLGRCRFGADCSHTHEPGCALKAAVEAGEVSARRFRSYLRMRG